MIEIVTEEHSKLIKSLFTKTNDSIRIISPFLSKDTAVLFCDAARKGVDCSFVTRFYLQDFVDGSNSIEGIQMMVDSGVKVYALIALHTKLYLFGKSDAIVGSANFTNGGLLRNVELSLHLNNEEHVLKELEDYFEEIRSKIEIDPDGRITQEMLDDMKDRYTKQKEKKKQLGDTNYTVFMRGAALDRKAKSVKENTGDAIAEIKNHIDERKDDVVFIALGGSRDDISYKTPQNIILKFSASAKKRADGNKPMDMHLFIDGGKSVYISNFSEARKNSAKSVEDGDETFFLCTFI
jgi:HKD family nuclease